MTLPTVRLASGEILVTGYQSMLDSTPEALEEPHSTLEIDLAKYKEIIEDIKTCGKCGKELQTWEINVNVVNYYNKFNRFGKKGRIKRRCYVCACKEM